MTELFWSALKWAAIAVVVCFVGFLGYAVIYNVLFQPKQVALLILGLLWLFSVSGITGGGKAKTFCSVIFFGIPLGLLAYPLIQFLSR